MCSSWASPYGPWRHSSVVISRSIRSVPGTMPRWLPLSQSTNTVPVASVTRTVPLSPGRSRVWVSVVATRRTRSPLLQLLISCSLLGLVAAGGHFDPDLAAVLQRHDQALATVDQ